AWAEPGFHAPEVRFSSGVLRLFLTGYVVPECFSGAVLQIAGGLFRSGKGAFPEIPVAVAPIHNRCKSGSEKFPIPPVAIRHWRQSFLCPCCSGRHPAKC